MIQLSELRDEFSQLHQLPKHERMLALCGLLSEYLQEKNIRPVIVGGLSVEIYTGQNYATYDIDLVTDGRDIIDKLLIKELGFMKEGRSWYHDKLELSIEIPDNFLEGNKEKVMELTLPSGRNIFVIGVEDIIIHRLESALVTQPDHPEWTDDYEWAERMFSIHRWDPDVMDVDYLKSAALGAGTGQIISNWLKE